MARLATILSFGERAEDDAVPEHAAEEQVDHRDQEDDAASDASGDSFEFSFARPLAPGEGEALADDLFAHGRMLPAYPVFHHRRRQAHHDDDGDDDAPASSATAPPSPDTYCAWALRSAPGSPAREPAAFPKSASTGTAEAARRFRLRDILGAGGRSHSDGKEKFLFFQTSPAKPKPGTSALSAAGGDKRPVKKPSPQKQGKKKAAAAATEMDMATAHRLFYSKPGAAAGAGGERTTTKKKSYLPYRPAIVGFFATAHALRPKHHPY